MHLRGMVENLSEALSPETINQDYHMKALKRFTRYDVAQKPILFFRRAEIWEKKCEHGPDLIYVIPGYHDSLAVLVEQAAANMYHPKGSAGKTWKEASGVEKSHWRAHALNAFRGIGIYPAINEPTQYANTNP